MPSRGRGTFGGGGAGGHGGHGGAGAGGNIELASMYVSIMPEVSKVTPMVKRALDRVAGETERTVASGWQRAFEKAETYSTGFAAKMANANLGILKQQGALQDSLDQLRRKSSDLDKVLSSKKSTTKMVQTAQEDYQRALRKTGEAVEGLGIKLASWNQKAEAEAKSFTQSWLKAEQQHNQSISRWLKAEQGFHDGRVKTWLKAEKDFERSQKQQTQSVIEEARRQRRELEFTAQHGQSSWSRMMAAVRLDNTATARHMQNQFGQALSGISSHGASAFDGMRRGALSATGLPLGVRSGAGGLALLGSYEAARGVDRIVKGGWNRLQVLQNSQVAMNAVLRNPAVANKLVGDITQLAQGTPFSAAQFMQGAREMTTMGVDPKQVTPAMEAISNATAAMGQTGTEMNQVALIFGKIQSEGRIMGRDVYELQRHGIDARRIIGNEMGMTGHEVTKAMSAKGGLDVDSAKIIDILTKGIMQGSDGKAGHSPAYGGAMQEMRKTVTGSYEVLKAQTDRLGAALMKPLFDRAPEVLNKISDGFKAMANPGGAMEQFSQRMGKTGLFDAMIKGVEKLPEFVGGVLNMFNKISAAADNPAVKQAFGIFKNDMREIWTTAKQIAPSIMNLGGAVAHAFAGTGLTGLTAFAKIFGALAPLISGVSNVLAGNQAILSTVVALWAAFELRAKAVNTVMPIAAKVMGAFSTTVMNSKTGMVETITIWDRMGSSFRKAAGDAGGFAGTMRGLGAGAFTGLKTAASGIMAMFGGPWGIALTAAGLGLAYLATKHEEAAQKAREQLEAERSLQSQLDQDTAALTDQAKQTITQKFQEGGTVDQARKLGIDPHKLLLAATGDVDAMQELQAKQRELAASGSSLTGVMNNLMDAVYQQNHTFVVARDKQHDYNTTLNGTWALTQKGIDQFKQYGLAVSEVPNSHTVQVVANTDEGRKALDDLRQKGFEVSEELGNPGHFKISANSDDAKKVLSELIQSVDNSHARIQLDLNTDQAVANLNNILNTIATSKPQFNLPPLGSPPGTPPVPVTPAPGQIIAPTDLGSLLGDGHKLGGIMKYGQGGTLPGYSPGVDNMVATLRGRPVALGGGEGILVPEAVAGLGGPGWVDAVNHHFAGRRGAGKPGYFNRGGVPCYDDGTGSAGGLNYAYQVAQSAEGARYQSGGASQSGVDCSGYASMIINAATGRNGGRMTTQSAEAYLTSMGAILGQGPAGTLRVGWYNHGPNPSDGHMAITMPNGMNAEAGGSGPGGAAQYGGSAMGADAPEFDHHAWFPYTALYPDGSVSVPPGSPLTASYGGGAGGGFGGGNQYGNFGQGVTPQKLQSLRNQVSAAERRLQDQNDAVSKAADRLEKAKEAKHPNEHSIHSAQTAYDEAVRHQQYDQSHLQDLQTQLGAAEQAGVRAPGSGGRGGSTNAHTFNELGKDIADGFLQSFGMDGSVFSDPRQWTGVKSIMALLSWFTKPMQGGAGGQGYGPGYGQFGQYGQQGYNPLGINPAAFQGTDANAATIVQQGMAAGANRNILQAALMASLQESGLNNKAIGDHGLAEGLFQEHPEWGSSADRQDPTKSAQWFFEQAMKVPGAAAMDPGALAQAVERSAFPGAYAPHAGQANDILNRILSGQGGNPGLGNYGFNPAGGGNFPDMGASAPFSLGGGDGGGAAGILGGLVQTLTGFQGPFLQPTGGGRNGGYMPGVQFTGGGPMYGADTAAPYNPGDYGNITPTQDVYNPGAAPGPGPITADNMGPLPMGGGTAAPLLPVSAGAGAPGQGQAGGGGRGDININFNGNVGWDPVQARTQMNREVNMQTRRYSGVPLK